MTKEPSGDSSTPFRVLQGGGESEIFKSEKTGEGVIGELALEISPEDLRQAAIRAARDSIIIESLVAEGLIGDERPEAAEILGNVRKAEDSWLEGLPPKDRDQARQEAEDWLKKRNKEEQ